MGQNIVKIPLSNQHEISPPLSTFPFHPPQTRDIASIKLPTHNLTLTPENPMAFLATPGTGSEQAYKAFGRIMTQVGKESANEENIPIARIFQSQK